MGESKSSTQHLLRGVPKGSVLGLIFFTIYTQPLGDIVHKHKMDYHLYADDTQLYLTFDSFKPEETSSALSSMEHCITDIKEWVLQNKLKLNGPKTEFLQFLPDDGSGKLVITIGEDSIGTSDNVKNLGVLSESDFAFSDHITSIINAANFQLFHLSCIRKYLTPAALHIAVHSLVSSCLDYCDSLLVGLPKYQIPKLQDIMNCAAQLISGIAKFDNIMPVMKSLHWLPVD